MSKASTPEQYYTNDGQVPKDAHLGEYQYVPLKDIVINFMLMYVGNDKLINNADRKTVLFHAKRGIQEFSYDSANEIGILELEVGSNLSFPFPHDYVNYVRMSQLQDGKLRILQVNSSNSFATAYLQDHKYEILFSQAGQPLEGTSHVDNERISGENSDPVINSDYNPEASYKFFGLETSKANANNSFSVDKKHGRFLFGSEMAGETCVLEYVSDGLAFGDDYDVKINKMAEGYLYAFIEHAILDTKVGIQEYVVRRAKKNKSSLRRNAKIRLGKTNSGKLLMTLRGQSKWVK
jgi:hypothetical protein